MTGYEALREGAAVINQSDRGRIAATGDDRARLLHAMSTNHVRQLQPGDGCYAFFLTAQGRIIADTNLLCLEEEILLDVEPEVRGRIFDHLDKYIIADDVTLEDRTDTTACVMVEGPKAAGVLMAVGLPVPEAPWSHLAFEGGRVARISAVGGLGFRLFLELTGRDAMLNKLSQAGAAAADAEALRVVRLENGVPRYGDDMTDMTLPMETGQSHGLHFSKGCYLGQEVVERVRSRGHVNRILAGLRIPDGPVPASGAEVSAEGVRIGKITSAVRSPALGLIVALAYLRVTHTKPGTEVEVGGVKATVVPASGPAQT